MAEAAPQEDKPGKDEGPPHDKRMSFLEHLGELRGHLRTAAISVVGAFLVAYWFRLHLLVLLARPLVNSWSEIGGELGLGKPKLNFMAPHEAFMVELKLALVAAIFLASPIIFRELWKFISPGLYSRERLWGLSFVLVSVVLFVGGALFCYLYVLPASYKFFLSYSIHELGSVKDISFLGHKLNVEITFSQPFDIQPMIGMEAYMGLTMTLLLVFGLVFELPLVLCVLAIMGIVSAKSLWRFNRYAIVLFAVAGAVLTPGDLVVGQLAMTGALTILYNLSILIAMFVGKKRKEREEAEEASSA
jgi:sec-independent protein translocase protein TatC